LIEKELKQNKKEIVFRRLQKKKLISIALVSMVVFLCINNSMVNTGICLNTLPNPEATILEQQHKEMMIKWIDWSEFPEGLATTLLPIDSIIQVNYTVLEKSNSSILFVPTDKDIVSDLWDPVPTNLTLAPGESFEETFTVKQGTASDHACFAFFVYVITENSNATIHWWYDVLERGKVPAGGFLIVGSALAVIVIVSLIYSKRKSNIKND